MPRSPWGPAASAAGPGLVATIRALVFADLDRAVEIVTLHDRALGPMAREGLGRGLGTPELGEEYLGADVDGRLVGILGHIPDPWGSSTIRWLVWGYVDPAIRRVGIGHLLFEHAEDRMRRLGCRKAYLDVGNADTHTIALAFYRKRGYAVEGTLTDFWADGDDFLVLGRRL